LAWRKSDGRTMPGERFADSLGGAVRGASLAARPGPGAVGAPFYSGEIADRGPIERPATPLPEPRARELRELERQRAWAMQATRALNDYRADGVDDSAPTTTMKASHWREPLVPPG